ncbi:EamA family transporter [Brucella sp. NBRC 12953]|uniref:DMT family transporter n=1 Tax=Brucella sp. NBRC 12953 TaxID=3075481 RepID=UPI000DE41857
MVGRTKLATELAFLLVLSTLWGASYTLIKVGVETIPPITLIAVRTLVAGGILVTVIWLRGLKLPRDRQVWTRFLFQACLNSVVPFTLIAWAEQSTEAGLATILNSTSPIFACLLTVLIARDESITVRKLVGILAGMAGICLIVGIQVLEGVGREIWAQLAIVIATICYAGAAVFGRNFNGLDPMMPAAGSLICGAAILTPISLIVDQPWALSPTAYSIVALLALSVFSTALALVIYFRLVRTLGPVGTTAQAYLRVPIGVAIGVVLLEEKLSSTAWIGMACVLVGVLAMTLPARKYNAPDEDEGSHADVERPRDR